MSDTFQNFRCKDKSFLHRKTRKILKFHLQIHLHIRMQRFSDRAGVGGAFKHCLLGVGVVVFREGDGDVDLSDAARVGGHGLLNLVGGAVDVEALALRCDTHDGHHAACQCGTRQIGGREGLALAVVVGRSVCYYRVS